MNAKQTEKRFIRRHPLLVSRRQREIRSGQGGFGVWLTGLPCSGKSTLAYALEKRLFHMGYATVVLDGDNLRHGLCGDLGFSIEHRRENIRRAAEVMKLFLETGLIVIGAFIAPLTEDRALARSILQGEEMVDIYCRCPVDVCEARDDKGLYRMARQGLIELYTGITAPYEAPSSCDLILETDKYDSESCVNQIISTLENKRLVAKKIVACK